MIKNKVLMETVSSFEKISLESIQEREGFSLEEAAITQEIDDLDSLEAIATSLEAYAEDPSSDQTKDFLEDMGISFEDVSSTGKTSIGRHIANVINTIMRVIKSLITRFINFFKILFGRTGALKLELKLLGIKVNKIAGRSPLRKQANISGYVTGVSTEVSSPRDAVAINKSLEALNKQLNVITNDYIQDVEKVGQDILETLRKWDYSRKETSYDLISNINQKASLINLDKYLSKIGSKIPLKDPRFDDRLTFTAAPLIGSRSLVFTSRDSSKESSSGDATQTLAIDSAIVRSQKIKLIRLRPNLERGKASVLMNTMSVSDIRVTLAEVKKLLDILDQETSRNTNKKLESLLADMLKETKRLLDQKQSIGTTNLSSIVTFTPSDYVSTFTRWSSEPYLSLIAHTLFVAKSVMGLCSRNIEAYK